MTITSSKLYGHVFICLKTIHIQQKMKKKEKKRKKRKKKKKRKIIIKK